MTKFFLNGDLLFSRHRIVPMTVGQHINFPNPMHNYTVHNIWWEFDGNGETCMCVSLVK